MEATRKAYPTDLTDSQWELIKGLIPAAGVGGRKRTTDIREVLNAIFYIDAAGCAWRMLPHDFPIWQTVYSYFRHWRITNFWQDINAKFQQWYRASEGREATPSAGCIDSQSTKIGVRLSCTEDVGIDGKKLVKGRKRHILVDTLGLLMMVVVTAANVNDRKGATMLLERLNEIRDRFPRLSTIFVDRGYAGKAFILAILHAFQWCLQVTVPPAGQKGFVVQQKRWVVERTFAWFTRFRRLNREYEVLPETSESFFYVGMIHILLRRLA
jgi:putative transposase